MTSNNIDTKEEIVNIESLGNEGEGVSHLASGQVVFIDGVLPGEKCRIQLEESTKKFTKGILVERLSDSPERIVPICGKYEYCGGCNLMHINYERELEYKRQKVFDCLTRIGGFEADFIDSVLQPVVGGESTIKYRNHMQYTIGTDSSNGCPRIGFKAASSNEFVEADECFTEYEIFGKIRKYMSMRLASYPTKLFEQMILRGSQRTKQILIEFTTVTSLPHEVLIRDAGAYLKGAELGDFIRNEGFCLKGIVLQICKDQATLKRRSGKRIVLEGEGFYDEILSGHTFRVNSGAFFQVNTEQAEKLYALAREGLGDANVIYDLYCGAGTIGLTAVGPEQTLFGIEISPEAVAAAKVNARLSGIENATFICKPCEKVLLSKINIPKPDAVITDPPRKGMDFSFVNQLIKLSIPRIAYVSCDPATMARDLRLLKETYKIEKITPVDMFSRSSHVETVVQLSKGDIDRDSSERKSIAKTDDIGMISGYNKGDKAPETTNVKIDFSLENLDLSELRGKATYEQIKDCVREQAGFRVSTLYISQVKRKCGLEVGESYNKPKSEDAKQPQCTPEKEAAIMQALRHYGMI